MKCYKLILVGRNPQTHKLRYQIACDEKIIVTDCSYPAGYQQIASLMASEDTFQEIQGEEKSRVLSYAEMLQGHLLMNWDSIHGKNVE